MLTYLGDDKLKRDFLEQIGIHEQLDAITKGTYGAMNGAWHGCAIGCSLRSLNILHGAREIDARTDDHTRYEKELGLPIWLAYLEDHLFETLPLDEAKTWPRRFAEAIPVGAVVDDLVLARILRWTLADTEFGVRYATDDEKIRGYIDGVIAGFDAEISTGGHATAEQREAAARAARAAWDAWAGRAAWAAWDAWAGRAAWAAWAARAARAAWDERLNTAAKAALFPTALARYVIEELRALALPSVVTK